MSKSSYEKGVEDAKNGDSPNLPKKENDVSDHIFFTTVSKEERAADREEYIKGYSAGSNQKSKED